MRRLIAWLGMVVIVTLLATGVASGAEPTWNSGFSTMTLQVGSSYEYSLAPDAATCNSAYMRARDGVGTRAYKGGSTQARSTATYGFWYRRENDHPRIPYLGSFGPVLGVSLELRGNELYLVGTPFRAASRLTIDARRYCIYEPNYKVEVASSFYLVFEGTGTHTASAHSVAHGHHHPEYALASAVDLSGYALDDHAHTGFAATAHTHPAPTGFVTQSNYDALLARVVVAEKLAGEFACTSNPNAFWDPNRINPHTSQLENNRTLLKVPAAVRAHCCVPSEPTHTLEQCFMTTAQRQAALPPPLGGDGPAPQSDPPPSSP